MKSTSTLLCGTLLAAMGMESAVADTVTLKLTGHVKSLLDPDGPVLGGQLHLGQPFTATFTYDPDTDDWSPDPEWSAYDLSPAQGAKARVSIGSFTFESSPTSTILAGVYNPASPDVAELLYLNSQPNKPLASGATVDVIAFELMDNDGTAFSSDRLPVTAFDVQAFATRELFVSGAGSNQYQVGMDIETAEVVPPAIDVSPASGFLLAQQNFDAAVFLPDDAIPSSMQVSVGSTVLPLSLSGTCQVLLPNSTGKRAILCPDAHAALASLTGNTKVSWQITLANGDIAVKTVEWNLIP